jgi:5-methylcytosine-specific restriction endonuclease McrA
VCEHTPDSANSPERLWLPVDEGQIEAARETLRDNKGAQWSLGVSIGLQIGDNVELRNNLIPFLLELDVPTATLSDMFNLSGRELWNIAAAEPVSVFACSDCGVLLNVRDRRDLLRLIRASRAISCARAGDPGDVSLLCDPCTELRLQLHNEEQRLRRLAQQARTAQLRKMPFAAYRVQPEWQQRRVRALTRARYKCQACTRRDTPLDVHHRTYQNYGDERLEDLLVLCRSCHQKLHSDPVEEVT